MSSVCPCCGKKIPTNGLFEIMPDAPLPDPLLLLDDHGTEVLALGDNSESVAVLEGWGRFFVPAEMPLPLHHPETPICPLVWIEISAESVQEIGNVFAGSRRSYSAVATVASSLPGFPGMSGASCRIRFRRDDWCPQIIDCTDERIASLPEDLHHEGMAALYREVWGNPDNLPAAKQRLRASLRKSLLTSFSPLSKSTEILPPPQIAGIDPGEVLVVPPLDTGTPAKMYTIGCSDVTDSEGGQYEIVSLLQNPSEDLIHCFGEFVYLSRMNPRSPLPGQIVPEKDPIPGSDGKMVAWMLLLPWEIPKPQDINIEFLYAVPLLREELAFAATHGPRKLEEEIRASGEDLTSLDRHACIPESFG